MKISRLASGVMATVALLAGCSGGGLQSSSVRRADTGLGPMGHDHLATYTSVRAPKVKPDHHKSWVSPDVKRAPRLLFISDDSTQDVYIFTMPAMQLKGTLTGFNGPQGMCTDRQGNIWIVNTGTAQGLKYSRTGNQLGSVSDPSGTPVGCAVNPTNGDLALSDIRRLQRRGRHRNLSQWLGKPDQIYQPVTVRVLLPGVRHRRQSLRRRPHLSGLRCPDLGVAVGQAVRMHTVNYSGGTIGFPGGVNWDRVNGQLVVNDQECNGLVRFVRVPADRIGFEREDRRVHPAQQLRRHCLRRRSRHDRSVQQVLRGPVHHFRIQRELGGSLGVSVGRYAGSLQRLGGRRTDRFGNQQQVATFTQELLTSSRLPGRARRSLLGTCPMHIRKAGNSCPTSCPTKK